MTKEEIKELQTNLISLVPSDIRRTKELTKSDKILLGQLVYLFGMDKAKANGYVFRSNDDLENDTQLSSQTIRFSINRLIKYGAINRTAGSRAEGASVYTLNFDVNGGEITAKSPLKITPKNHPYLAKDEVEAMIEGLRAEFQQQINELQMRIAHLEGVKSDDATAKSPLKITPKQSEITPQIQNSEKEPYHIQPYSNTIESNDYRADAGETDFNEIEGNTNDGEVNPSNADEVVPSNEGDQTGSVSDFQKIEGNDPDEVDKSQATANKASGSVATPQTIQTTTDNSKRDQSANKGANPVSGNTNLNPEERINQLDALQLWKMNTPNVNPIELATELGKILTNGVTYQSNAYNKAEKVGCYLALYANDLDTLNQIETALTSGHIKKYGTSTVNLNDAFAIQRNYLSNPQTLETSPEPHQSHADHSDKETITNEQKRAQKRPDKAGEGLKVDKAIDALLTKLANLNAQFVAGDHEAAQKAEKLMNKVCKCCGETDAIGVLNWCALNIPTMLEKHGRVLGTNVNLYLSVIPNVIANRRKELLAA